MPYSVVTAQQACSTEMVKVAGNAYSVVTAQQACSTEMVKVAGNAVLSGHSAAGLSTEMVKVAGNAYSVVTAQQACSTEMVKATYTLGSTNSWIVALCAGLLVYVYVAELF